MGIPVFGLSVFMKLSTDAISIIESTFFISHDEASSELSINGLGSFQFKLLIFLH